MEPFKRHFERVTQIDWKVHKVYWKEDIQSFNLSTRTKHFNKKQARCDILKLKC